VVESKCDRERGVNHALFPFAFLEWMIRVRKGIEINSLLFSILGPSLSLTLHNQTPEKGNRTIEAASFHFPSSKIK
jgi:hypothetical protein